MSESERERAELLRTIFDSDTSNGAVRQALARILSLELPPPLGLPVILATTQGLAGYSVGQESVVTAIRDSVRRTLFGDPTKPGRLNAQFRTDGQK